MNERYEIGKLTDFAKVPKDRRSEMLSEFEEWLDILDEIKPLMDAGLIFPQNFIWMDDGERGCKEIRLRPIEDTEQE